MDDPAVERVAEELIAIRANDEPDFAELNRLLEGLTQQQKNQVLLRAVGTSATATAIGHIVAAGADPNCADENGDTPLHFAIEESEPDALIALLDLGAQPVQNKEGCTPLHDCAGEMPHTEILIDRFPALVNVLDNEGCGPIFSANGETFPLFMIAKADLTGRQNGRSLLWYAPRDWAGALLLSGVRPDPDILLRADELSHSDIVSLIRAGASPNVANEVGDTPLHIVMNASARTTDAVTDFLAGILYADRPADVQMVRLLLSEGASPTARNKDGVTLLHCADCPAIIRELHMAAVETGADIDAFVNAQTNTGVAPIHMKADAESLKLLTKLGANLNIRDNNGNTPLHLAAQHGRGFAVEFLLKSGAYTDIRNSDGQTPLAVAMALAEKCQLPHRGRRVARASEDAVNHLLTLLKETANPSIEGKAAAKKK